MLELHGNPKTASNGPGLLSLPTDILRIIVEEVYSQDPKSFKKFGLVAKTCRRETEYRLFRTVQLYDTSETAAKQTHQLLDRFCHDEDFLCSHIRDLKIGPLLSKQEFTDVTRVLQKTLQHFTNIQSLTWHNEFHIPEELLNEFHAKFPLARINVNQSDRIDSPIDQALLSSPQLHSLEIKLLYTKNGPVTTSGELPILKQCLIKGQSLKMLDCTANTIRAQRKSFREQVKDERLPLSFDWKAEDCFPALEELRIAARDFDLSAEQCDIWAKCMDWGKIRRLDIVTRDLSHILKSLSGKVPHLESLALGVVKHGHFGHQGLGLPQLSVVESFFSSAESLKELRFHTAGHDSYVEAWEHILSQCGSRLERLDLKSHSYMSMISAREQCVALLGQAPTLVYFKAIIGDHEFECKWKDDALDLPPTQKFGYRKEISKRPFFVREDGLDLRGM
ncbi:hypothetical protein BS50DRAFT_615105 [Corynespora cassiicola Philippines]|uniref:F-box domain-containing protein n=1 Tax=Corynespora cassiicola Philippines TaxID=1448308 RepID=A0A2T2P917_CORCC|nr:hypothetical protein BS50DRAFT_615105 [Corynespora cassiicola Philippines]